MLGPRILPAYPIASRDMKGDVKGRVPATVPCPPVVTARRRCRLRGWTRSNTPGCGLVEGLVCLVTGHLQEGGGQLLPTVCCYPVTNHPFLPVPLS